MGSSRIGALTRSMIDLAAQALSHADIACVVRRNQALSEKKFYICYVLEFLICFHFSKQRRGNVLSPAAPAQGWRDRL
jgi:hypothetical protein